MKPLTNILLVAYIIIYLFLPLFDVAFEGGWNGFSYTAETISNSGDLGKQLFALMPFAACFSAIGFNCMKNRYWGLAVAACICGGIYFYASAKDFVNIQLPQFYTIKELGIGFNIGYCVLFLALISAMVSVLPFSFNKFHAREILSLHRKKELVTPIEDKNTDNDR